MNFEEAKKNLMEKKQAFEDIGDEYKRNSFKRDEFSKSKDEFEKALDSYEPTLTQLSKEEYDKEYKEALRYHEFAVREYDPFLAVGTLAPSQNPPPIPFNPLAVASFRKDLAWKWTNIMARNIK